jgi:hypothetical protein
VLLLDERILADGVTARTYARFEDARLHLRDDDGTEGALSIAAVERVMSRYGRALDREIPLVGEVLELADGTRLRRLHFHAIVDAEGRDYLVWERAGQEPLAVIATMATAALRYLVLRLGAEKPSDF